MSRNKKHIIKYMLIKSKKLNKMNNFKINLRSTNFKMKGNLTKNEPKQLLLWKNRNIYKKDKFFYKNKKIYIVYDGPPYANGNIHLGHALNKILKDIFLRLKHINDFNVNFCLGWDCHGLPIELQIEKKLNLKHNLDQKITTCKKYAKIQITKQKKDFARLGLFVSKCNNYRTFDTFYKFKNLKILSLIAKNNYLFEGKKPTHWCFNCNSSLSEAETEYKIKKSLQIYTNFCLYQKKQKINFIIWTTTPWSILANKALAISKNIMYCLIKHKKNINIVATQCLTKYKTLTQTNVYIIKQIIGKKLLSLLIINPLSNNKTQLIQKQNIIENEGTGIIHIAPYHGHDDYFFGKLFNLKINSHINIITTKKYYFLKTKSINNLNLEIAEHISNKKCMLLIENLLHKYPFCWRHKVPLFFMTTSQWFINVGNNNKIIKKIIKNSNTITWVPEKKKIYYKKMLENRPDWCISRQRVWGTPFLVIQQKQNTRRFLNKFIKLIAFYIGKKINIKNLVQKLSIKTSMYTLITNTLDVWFDSGIATLCTTYHNKNLHYPVDIFLEGHDQCRGWFQTSIITSILSNNTLPTKNIISHGFIVDSKNKKMSKSLNNIISPEKIIQNSGAEILRIWISTTTFINEISFTNTLIENSKEQYKKIRNILRFLINNTSTLKKYKKIKQKKILLIDQWCFFQKKTINIKISNYFIKKNLSGATKLILFFLNKIIGNFYINLIKDRIYLSINKYTKFSTQNILLTLLNNFLFWFYPVIPFTIEEVYFFIKKIKRKPFTTFYNTTQITKIIFNKNKKIYWILICNFKKFYNKILEKKIKKNEINNSLNSRIIIFVKKSIFSVIKKINKELKFIFLTSNLCITNLSKYDFSKISFKYLIQKEIEQKCIRCWIRYKKIFLKSYRLKYCLECYNKVIKCKEKPRFFN